MGSAGTDELESLKSNHQNLAIQKQERTQRLILRRRGDFSLRCEVSQERTDVACVEVSGMLSVVEEDEAPNPGDIRIFGSTAVVACLRTGSDLVEQSWGLGRHS